MRRVFHGNKGRGIARRKELNNAVANLQEQIRGLRNGTMERYAECFVVNNTLQELPAYSVLQISGKSNNPAGLLDYTSAEDDVYKGITPTDADSQRIIITQSSLKEWTFSSCRGILAGATIARIRGPVGQFRATVVAGQHYLEAGNVGLFRIIYDFSSGDTGERFALVAFSGEGDGGNSSSSGSTGVCSCATLPDGSVLVGGHRWAENYEITNRDAGQGSIISTHVVTWQGTGWESDEFYHTCDAYPDPGGDGYTLQMNASGANLGAVSVQLGLTSGANAGNAGCCPSTPSGLVQTYRNEWDIDPLATFDLRRVAGGFEGRECNGGSCIVCVRPLPAVATSCNNGAANSYRVSASNDGTEDWATFTGLTHDRLEILKDGAGDECTGTCVYLAPAGPTSYYGFISGAGYSCEAGYPAGVYPYEAWWRLNISQLPTTAPCKWYIVVQATMWLRGNYNFSAGATYRNDAHRAGTAADTPCYSNPPVSDYPLDTLVLERVGYNNGGNHTGVPPSTITITPIA